MGFTVHQNTFLFGMASDGDTLDERFAGITARYENKHLGTDRVGLRFQFESYHEQWNQSTLNALAAQPSQTSRRLPHAAEFRARPRPSAWPSR